MPVINKFVNVPASSQVDNALSGDPFEFLPYDAQVSIGIVAPTAAAAGDIIANVTSGSDILCQDFGVPNLGTVDVTANLYLSDVAEAGDRLVVRLRNTTATARICQVMARIDPIPSM